MGISYTFCRDILNDENAYEEFWKLNIREVYPTDFFNEFKAF